ncbi:outer membrane protein assembly factor BamB family protein [Streptomyces poonensis]|uniref:Pyrrolo-quinoline quinone repeat domain-containing protein n=1 Tax=Streptomyces poonensis TaxID=68255 RepID=A0A918PB12_9ACTN|nr:PQQ-binding-like beta-propeller repeat protein [Streptomyces poonensis]GGY93416.1 hypothetical protein GCM10010365_10070 [Streptomyces poonensis]GLJ87553.1 hypothetical protein GCM10017589_01530 [Streptomyces poonensis]
MTQPPDRPPASPPPPNQPPQSGFGAPVPPPPPGPHGPQPGPYAQPPYGYGPPPAPGGGGLSGSRLALVVAAMAAFVMVVVGGAWYAISTGKDEDGTTSASSGGGTGGTSGGTGTEGEGGQDKAPAELLLKVPAPKAEGQRIDSVKGSWLTGSVYAKAGVDEIVGYDAHSGDRSWTLPLSGQTCGGSGEVTDDGVAVVVHKDKKRGSDGSSGYCSRITAFEVSDGEKLWTRTVEERGSATTFNQVVISGTTVAVAGYLGGAAFDARTGESLWTPKTGDCLDSAYTGGAQLVVVRMCGDIGEEEYEIQLLDPKSGVSKWSHKLPAGVDTAEVISTEPVVYAVGPSEADPVDATEVFSLDDSGRLRAKIELAGDTYHHTCGSGQAWGCAGITVGNGKLYVSTKYREGTAEFSRTNEIVSFSLDTGRSTGERVEAGDDYTLFPLRMDGSDLIAYKEGVFDKGDQVISVDGSSSKATVLLETPAHPRVLGAMSGIIPYADEVLYADGRLFLAKEQVSKPRSEDGEEYAALGFGVK